MSDNTSPGPLGCLGLILFLVIEIAAGFAVGAACYGPVFAGLGGLFPASERDMAGVVSVIICFIPGGLTAWAIDRLCVRLTGHSVFDNMPYLP